MPSDPPSVATYAEVRLGRKTFSEIAGQRVFEVGKLGGQAYSHPLPVGKFLVALGSPALTAGAYDSRLDTYRRRERANRRGLV